MAKCRRCGLKTVLEKEDIDKMLDALYKSGAPAADDAAYNRRIAACMECEKLEYGSTCILCGAVVQVRCRMARGRCPYPGKAKWR